MLATENSRNNITCIILLPYNFLTSKLKKITVMLFKNEIKRWEESYIKQARHTRIGI